MADNSKDFLKKHMSEIVEKTRTPITIADALLAEGYIIVELYNKIKTQRAKEDQMREIYQCLNSEKHFAFTYDWLKKNEADLIEELEKKGTKAAAPQRKNRRDENKPAVDEPDNNHTGFLDLKKISTFAKLEKWVSENSQQLISDLEEKIGEEQMKDLENKLKNKKLKTNLCFSDTNIEDIRTNRDLDKSRFPNLTLRMFFDDISSGKKGKSSTASDKPAVMTADDLNSSGYGSYKSEQSSLNLTQNDAETSDEAVFTESSHTRDTNPNENKDNKDMQETQKDETDGQTEPPGQPPNVSPKSPNQSINESMMKPLQKNSPASASDNMSSNVSWDTQQNSEAEIIAQNMDTEMPAPEKMQHPVQERKSSSMRNPPSTSGANEANKAKKNNYRNKLLHDWAEKQCKGSKEEVKEILDQISFIYKTEHRDYQFFTAENVIVYNNPTTHESQIIYIRDKKKFDTKVQYYMFVCDIKKAILLDPEEKESKTELNETMITYKEYYLRINKCLGFISEAFAPALAVYKKVQKEELYSLI